MQDIDRENYSKSRKNRHKGLLGWLTIFLCAQRVWIAQNIACIRGSKNRVDNGGQHAKSQENPRQAVLTFGKQRNEGAKYVREPTFVPTRHSETEINLGPTHNVPEGYLRVARRINGQRLHKNAATGGLEVDSSMERPAIFLRGCTTKELITPDTQNIVGTSRPIMPHSWFVSKENAHFAACWAEQYGEDFTAPEIQTTQHDALRSSQKQIGTRKNLWRLRKSAWHPKFSQHKSSQICERGN